MIRVRSLFTNFSLCFHIYSLLLNNVPQSFWGTIYLDLKLSLIDKRQKGPLQITKCPVNSEGGDAARGLGVNACK